MTKFFFCTECHSVRSVYSWRFGRNTCEDEVCESCAYCAPDEDAARYAAEERRKQNDDRDEFSRHEERSGAYHE